MSDDREIRFFEALFEWADDLHSQQPMFVRTTGNPVPRIPVRMAVADELCCDGGVIHCDGGMLVGELSVLQHDLDYANQTLESALQVDWGHLGAVLTFHDAEGQLFHLASRCPDSVLCIPNGTAMWPLDDDERYQRRVGSPYTPESFYCFGLNGDDVFDYLVGFAPVSVYGKYMSWCLEASDAIGFVDCVVCIGMQAGEFENIPFPLYFRHRVPLAELMRWNMRPQSDGWNLFGTRSVLRQCSHRADSARAGVTSVELTQPDPPVPTLKYIERHLGKSTDLGLIDWFRTEPEQKKWGDVEVEPDRELRFPTMLITPRNLGNGADFRPVADYYARELYGHPPGFRRTDPDPEPHSIVIERPFSWRTFPCGVWDPVLRLAPAEYVFREQPKPGQFAWCLGIRDGGTKDVWHCGGIIDTERLLPSEGTLVDTGPWLWGGKPDLEELARQVDEDERRLARWPRMAQYARIEYERAVNRRKLPWGLPMTFSLNRPLNLMLGDRPVAIDLQDNVRCSHGLLRPEESDSIEAKQNYKTFGTVRLSFEATDVLAGDRVRFRHTVSVNPLIALSSTITVPHDSMIERPSHVTLYY